MVSLGAGLLLGLFPALQNRGMDMAATIRAEATGGGSGGKLRMRNALVIAQVAISLFLLLGAGLFARSLGRMEAVDPGFGSEPAGVLDFAIINSLYETEAEGRELIRRMVERFERLPGVEAVGLTNNLHLNPMNQQSTGINVDGVEPPPGREFYSVDRAEVDAGFFPATGIRILDGRNFDDRDQPDSQPVGIISQAMAQKFWPGGSAVGQMVRRGDADVRVIGVASDAKVRSLGEAPISFLYLPLSQNYTSFLTVVARTRMAPGQTALGLLEAVGEIDPELPAWNPRTMKEHLRIVLLPARMTAAVLAAFAVVAVTLVVIGLFGVVGYAAAQRRREVGIRMSLGATPPVVVRLMMSTGLRLVLIGGGIGLGLTILSTRLMSGLLFQVSALDPVTLVAVILLLLGVSGAATLFPAWNASRIDPAEILRAE
jgi:predicted permease